MKIYLNKRAEKINGKNNEKDFNGSIRYWSISFENLII